MVIHWSSFREEVVFYETGQSTRNLGQYRVLRPHCPEVNSEAKDMENCRYILLFLEIFLVFQIDRGNLRMVNANTTSLTIKSM